MFTANSSIKRKLQWTSAVLLVISALLCVLVYINIPPIIEYAIETKRNQGLQLYLYLVLASLPNGIALLLLIISLIIKEKP